MIPFLDLKVSLEDGKNFYWNFFNVKLADHHQYLHFSPAIPNRTKRSVVFNQTLRISILCSSESNFVYVSVKKRRKGSLSFSFKISIQFGISLKYSVMSEYWVNQCTKSVRIRSYSSSYFPTFELNTER